MKGQLLRSNVKQLLMRFLCPSTLPPIEKIRYLAGCQRAKANRGHGGKHAAMCIKCTGRQCIRFSKYNPNIEDAKHREAKKV